MARDETQTVLRALARPGPVGAWPADLDADDRRMLALFAKAAPRDEVARALGCSTATVDRRMQRLKTSLRVDTVVQVVVRAVRDDLI